MNLRNINLNLLKTLQVLLETRNVTVASKTLFLTQPAVSSSLKQLRILFDDPLLIKGNDRFLELTHKAKRIKLQLDQLLKQAESLIGIHTEMVTPEKLEETFHIALHNRVSSLIFPKLYKIISKIAPLVMIKHTDVTDLNELSTQELQQFDFIIGAFDDIPKNYHREYYFSDQFICLSGVKSLNTKSNITIEDLNQYEHIILSYMSNYTKTFGETLLVSQGIQRKYRMIVSDVLLAVQLAYSEELLLIMMKKRAEFLQKIFPLKIFDLPFESLSLKTEILYKKADQDDPAKQWFKTLLQELVQKEI